jgi:hypothetical protein
MEKKMEEVENKIDENRKEMEKKMNENNAHMENKMDENMYQMEKKMNEMKKSIESLFVKGILKELQRSTEILKIRKKMVFSLNHIWGVCYHNWRAQILNLKFKKIHYSKFHIIKSSCHHQ